MGHDHGALARQALVLVAGPGADVGDPVEVVDHEALGLGDVRHRERLDANVARVLRLAAAAGLECPLEVDEASYFHSKIELHTGDEPGLSRWRKHLFVATSRITADAAEYFGAVQLGYLPRLRVEHLGADDRPDLRPLDQLGADGLGADARVRLPHAWWATENVPVITA